MKCYTYINKVILLLFLIILTAGCYSSSSLCKIASTPNLRADSALVGYLRQKKIALTTDNKVQLLQNAHEKFTVLFQDIQLAKHSIHLEYFNFRNDSISNLLFSILKKKAKEGVEVRVIIDAFGNSSNDKPLSNRYLKTLRKDGIQIKKFDPIVFPFINHALHRDHRKIAVIDNKIGFVGGINIADYYIKGLPKIGDWRDLHIRVEGTAVTKLQLLFLEMWKKVTPKEKVKTVHNHKKEYVNGKTIAIVDRTPKETPHQMINIYIKAIYSARREIKIVNPYFLPTKPLRKAIINAIVRGVNVQIMFSAKSDIPFINDAMYYLGNNLAKQGVKIYLYQTGFHHSKIMIIDNEFCSVGSVNFNSRSMHYDYEVTAFIIDGNKINNLVKMFNKDKNSSVLMTHKLWKNRTLWRKFVGWFANLFTFIL